MNFGTAFKVFQMNLLRQAGVTVTPQQFGLKSDPIADLQAKNATGSFSNVLGGLTPPTPPTPPADLTDSAAQTKYRQDLLTYNNNFQVYNQRVMQMMLSQFQSLQQSMAAIQKNNSSSATNSSDSTTASGVGGILG